MGWRVKHSLNSAFEATKGCDCHLIREDPGVLPIFRTKLPRASPGIEETWPYEELSAQSLGESALEDLVDPAAGSGKDTGNGLFSSDHLVLEEYPMGSHAKPVESFQFLSERLDVPLLLGEPLDGDPECMPGLGRKTAQIIEHLLGDTDRNHNSSRAETGW